MAGRILDIATNGRSVHLERGFVTIKDKSTQIAKIPLADIDSIIISAKGSMWSSQLVSALANQGSSFVVVGENFHPSIMLLPCDGHHAQGKRVRAQADAKLPLRKRLWAQIVKAKILAQAEALKRQGKPMMRLKRLADEVRSGDPDNREAVAAQSYWPTLLGRDFRRERDGNRENAMLNYGYAILRSATARAIVAAGLHPSLALHHISGHDAYCLADDLMEPFRPAVDLLVVDLVADGAEMDQVETRAKLASVLDADYLTSNGHTPLSVVLVKLSQSLAAVYEGGSRNLALPTTRLPVIDEVT